MIVCRGCLVEALLCIALAGACGDGPQQATPRSAGRSLQGGERVVARVNGVPILADDLRHQLQGDAREPRAALAQLVRLELLAQEARRRGLAAHPEVRWVERQAVARLLVQRDFGETFTRASIPRQLVRRAYEQNKHRFVHPELVEVCHLLASVTPRAAPAEHSRARRVAQRARKLAGLAPRSPEAFLEIPQRLRREGGADGVKLMGESLVTPREGFTVEPFAAAAFALRQPGDLSPVVQTRFGYHVIRERVFEEARRIAFEDYLSRIEARHRIEYPSEAPATGEGQR
jgi:peptidyl-prolyl cis-trans isomerase C